MRRLPKRIVWQLAIFAVVSVTATGFMTFGYLRLPNLLFGIGHYSVTVQLPETGGLYDRANVTFLGNEVGQVKHVGLTPTGVEATLSLRSDIRIPSNVQAQVHSVSAVGEQYIALLPQGDTSPPLKDGDVISRENTTIPPDINALLDATNRGLKAIPADNLKTVVDESYTAVGGLGPDISRIVKGSTSLAIDARNNLDALTNVIDNGPSLLDTQTDTADAVQAWAAHLATVTGELKRNDAGVQGILQKGAGAADAAKSLFDRLQPTLPVILANLTSIAPVLVTYRDNIEQLLVLLPLGTAALQTTLVPDLNTKQDYRGVYLDFHTNLNLPPPCTTGFLPAQQRRSAEFQDYPDRPAGNYYCRIPQDSTLDVRGVRNTPCVTRPGKRAPTVKMCESDENYVPLNEGYNWKGDPNATLSGQDIPQLPPGPQPAQSVPAPEPAPLAGDTPQPIAVAEYDPTTGTYIGPDGHVYRQSDLADNAKGKTWQSMLTPPTGN
jgi:phospholipid/cholesterol/gamma-HCH transport system substrate-binding protein